MGGESSRDLAGRQGKGGAVAVAAAATVGSASLFPGNYIRATEQGACVSRASVYLDGKDGTDHRVRKLGCAWIDDEKP